MSYKTSKIIYAPDHPREVTNIVENRPTGICNESLLLEEVAKETHMQNVNVVEKQVSDRLKYKLIVSAKPKKKKKMRSLLDLSGREENKLKLLSFVHFVSCFK